MIRGTKLTQYGNKNLINRFKSADFPSSSLKLSRTLNIRVFMTSGQAGLLDWDPSASEARYVSHNCRPLHQYRTRFSDRNGNPNPASGEVATITDGLYDLIAR